MTAKMTEPAPWKLAAIALLAVLASCGGDSPEAVRSALGNAAPNLAYVDPPESDCVADVVLNHVGFEQLAAEGHTSETLTNNPDSIADIAAVEESEELREALVTCFDIDAMFEASLVELNLDEPLECTNSDEATPDLRTQVIDRHFASDDSPLEISDTEEHRDLLRPCLGESAFASVFDLDTAEDLAVAIDAELGDDFAVDVSPCVGPLVIDAIGSAEATNRLGITVDEPTLVLADLDLGTEITNELKSQIFDCGTFVEQTLSKYKVEEPNLADCMVDELASNDVWREAKVTAALGSPGSAYSAGRRVENARDDCLEARIEDIWGDVDKFELSTAKDFGIGFHGGVTEEDDSLAGYGHTLADIQCAAYGMLADVSLTRWIAAFEPAIDNPDNMTIAQFDELVAVLRVLDDAIRACVGDFNYLAVDITRAGFSSETISCIHESLGDVVEMADMAQEANFSNDINASIEMESIVGVLHDAVDDCYSDDERDVYEDWRAWFDGFTQAVEYGEPDTLLT